jgi:hypothetical protein
LNQPNLYRQSRIFPTKETAEYLTLDFGLTETSWYYAHSTILVKVSECKKESSSPYFLMEDNQVILFRANNLQK